MENKNENSRFEYGEVLVFAVHREDCQREKYLIKESFYAPEQLRTK